MSYDNDSGGQWRDEAEDHAKDAANTALLRVDLVPLAVAVSAIALVVWSAST